MKNDVDNKFIHHIISRRRGFFSL